MTSNTIDRLLREERERSRSRATAFAEKNYVRLRALLGEELAEAVGLAVEAGHVTFRYRHRTYTIEAIGLVGGDPPTDWWATSRGFFFTHAAFSFATRSGFLEALDEY